MHIFYRKWANRLPASGIIVAIALLIVAAPLYPGGTRFNNETPGYDWLYNYLCDLIETPARNGMDNLAQPMAMAGYTIGVMSLALFFVQFATHMAKSKSQYYRITFFGAVSMMMTLLVVTDHHDWVIGVASTLGLVALGEVMYRMLELGWRRQMYGGLACALLVVVNNAIFYTHGDTGMVLLPITQKLAFAGAFLWVIYMSSQIFRLVTNR